MGQLFTFQCHLLPTRFAPFFLSFNLDSRTLVCMQSQQWMGEKNFVLRCWSNSNNHTGFSTESDIENWKCLHSFPESALRCQIETSICVFVTGCCKSSIGSPLKVEYVKFHLYWDEKFIAMVLCECFNYYHHSAVFHIFH